ncbi:MAG TPA: stage III sporulation protein AF [Pseudogracilibacillus sp.]|nr:stage III sporulation protein AF [Pseudogracilibacillus sp.]
MTEWVTQIVVFIFIGTILDLIIPNQSMKRYVHIVVGLTLLLILIKPILFVFQEHIPSAISKIETAIEKQDMSSLVTEKDLDFKKDEIHEQQDAYIWNEVSSQLIYEANKRLEEEGIAISVTDIQFETKNESTLTVDNVDKLIVSLSQTDSTDNKIESVEPIVIGKEGKNDTSVEFPNEDKVKKELAQLWGIEGNKIEYIWEEGAT